MSKNVKQAHFTACSNSLVLTEIQGGAWARVWKVVGIIFFWSENMAALSERRICLKSA